MLGNITKHTMPHY